MKNIKLGYFVVKFVGEKYLNIINIPMEGQESLSEIMLSN